MLERRHQTLFILSPESLNFPGFRCAQAGCSNTMWKTFFPCMQGKRSVSLRIPKACSGVAQVVAGNINLHTGCGILTWFITFPQRIYCSSTFEFSHNAALGQTSYPLSALRHKSSLNLKGGKFFFFFKMVLLCSPG